MRCDQTHGLLRSNERLERKTAHHVKDDASVLAFHCGTNLIVCNLHPHESYPYYKIGSEFGGTYELVLDTDAVEYGGYGRLDKETRATTENGACDWQSAAHPLSAMPCQDAVISGRRRQLLVPSAHSQLVAFVVVH